MLSRKHRENEVKSQSRVDDRARSAAGAAVKASSPPADQPPETPATHTNEAPPAHPTSAQPGPDNGGGEGEEEGEEEASTLDEKIAAARSKLSPLHCLFCARVSPSLEDNLTHMSGEHSFFIPDAEYLVDIAGLVAYLGEKIAVGNVCIYCNDKGREFRTLDAVRKHMLDKSHCKIAYDTERDMLEMSDYYDFSSSYPDAEERRQKKKAERKRERAAAKRAADAAAGWEDVDEEGEEDDGAGGEVDEVVDEPPSSSSSSSEEEEEEDEEDTEDDLPQSQITYGDSHLELVLPSGNRIGHRSMRRYYAQSFPGAASAARGQEGHDGRSIVRRLLADKHSALVPRRGGFGAFGAGTEVVKARNRGEAREAGRHVREFRDQKRKEDYKTRVAFVHNHQKHYRDPLLQVCLFFPRSPPNDKHSPLSLL